MRNVMLGFLVAITACGGGGEERFPTEPDQPCAGVWPPTQGFAVDRCDQACTMAQPELVGPSSCGCAPGFFVEYEWQGAAHVGCCEYKTAGPSDWWMGLRECP